MNLLKKITSKLKSYFKKANTSNSNEAPEIVNLTPHDIHLYEGDAIIHTWKGLGDDAARVSTVKETKFEVKVGEHLIPVKKTEFGDMVNMPPKKPNTFYVVSLICATKLKTLGRNDILTIDGAVRDDKNRVIGFRNFGIM